uniref:Uncharacterized protein n=1 Tax=Octopus bimaculoides TaxID=37653 RepID=A0A0L8I4C2_OCTBM
MRCGIMHLLLFRLLKLTDEVRRDFGLRSALALNRFFPHVCLFDVIFVRCLVLLYFYNVDYCHRPKKTQLIANCLCHVMFYSIPCKRIAVRLYFRADLSGEL